MVAAIERRRRVLSIWLTTLMVGSTVLALVPTTEAAYSLPAVSVYVYRGSGITGQNLTATDLVASGEEITLRVMATVSRANTDICVTPNTVVVNASTVVTSVAGHTSQMEATAPVFGNPGPTDNPQLHTADIFRTFKVQPRADGLDGGTFTFTPSVTTRCSSDTAPAATHTAATRSIRIDNVVPTASPAPTLTLASGHGGIGSQIQVPAMTLSPDTSYWVLNMSEFDNQNGYLNISTTSIPATTFTVRETAFANPDGYLLIVDNAGNKNNIDLTPSFVVDNVRPGAPGGLANGTIATGPTVPLSWTAASGGDIVSYNLTLLRSDGTTTTLDVGNVLAKTLTRADWSGLLSSRHYNVTVRATDDNGNQGPASPALYFPTLSEASATVAFSVNGSGKLGDTVTITVSNLVDATTATVDVSQISATSPLLWGTGGFAPGTSTTVTITQTATSSNAATISAVAQGTGAPSAVDVTYLGGTDGRYPFDARAPSAPTGVIATSLPSKAIELSFVPSEIVDATQQVTWGPENGATTTVNLPAPTSVSGGRLVYKLEGTSFPFVTNTTYNFSVRTVDKVGNIGPASGIVNATANDRPLAITMWQASAGAAAVAQLTGSLNGTWLSPTDLANDYASLYLTLRSLDRPTAPWFTGDASDVAGGSLWSATPPRGAFVARTLGGGTWTADNFTVTGTNATAVQALPSGRYEVIANLTVSGLTTSSGAYSFILDKTAPAPLAGAGDNVIQSPLGQQQGKPVRVGIDFLDAHSGVDKLVFEILSGGSLATTLNGAPARVTCVEADTSACKTTISTTPSGESRWDVEIPFRDMAPGPYTLRVVVSDAVGNAAPALTLAGTLYTLPRLELYVDSEFPFGSASGLEVQAYAAWDNRSSFQPNQTICPANVCRVTNVSFIGRNITNNVEKFLATRAEPQYATPGEYPEGSGTAYYYYPASISNLQTLTPTGMEVRARAQVNFGNGTVVQVVSEWVRVRTAAAPGGLRFASPADNTTVFLHSGVGGNGQRPLLNVTYEQAGLFADPTLAYTVFVANSSNAANVGRYISFATGATSATPLSLAAAITNGTGGPRYVWNLTNTTVLPAGEYIVNATLTLPSGETRFASRLFGLEDSVPVIDFTVAQPEIYNGQAPQNFDLHAVVEHGYANVSRTSFTAQLTPGTGASIVLDTLEAINETHSKLVFNVTLPTDASESQSYTFGLNATTLSSATGGAALANATATYPITPDKTKPRAVVDAATTNSSGAVRTNPLFIAGRADDARGAGVGRVEVRIVNLDKSQTFVRGATANGTWLDGELNAWMTSDLVRQSDGNWSRDIVLQPCGTASIPTLTCWALYDATRPKHDANGVATGASFGAIGLDRSYTYRVEVRAFDRLGLESIALNWTVVFDNVAPQFAVSPHLSASGDAADLKVGWHGSGILRTNVSDNHCVEAVRLVGTRPDGQALAPVNFTRTTPLAVCSSASSNQPWAWELNLSQHPEATHVVGWHNYSVEIEDAVGNVVRSTHKLQVLVEDTTPANILDVRPEPRTLAVDTPSTIRISIEEFGELSIVEATFNRIVNGNIQFMAQGRATFVSRDATNGTYEYIADTDDLGITSLPVGDYLWIVKAYDTNAAVTCAPPNACDQFNQVVFVRADAAPFISIESPAVSTSWLPANVTFAWRVFNYNGDASGLTVQVANDSGVFRDVAPTTYTAVRAASGNVTGANITYRATLEPGNVSLRVRALAPSGFANTSPTSTFRVDPTPPNVTQNVTGLVRVAGKDWAVGTTLVRLAANDTLSGIASLTYRIGAQTSRAYSGPINLADQNGEVRITWTATDNATNTVTGVVTVEADTDGPTITAARRTDSPLFAVRDDGVGVNTSEVTVFYAYGDDEFQSIKATSASADSFGATLGGSYAAEGLRFYVVARDLLGNVGTLGSATDPEVLEKEEGNVTPPPPPLNHAPVITIASPTPGSQVRTSVTLQWEITDEDGDPVQVSVGLKTPTVPDGTTIYTGTQAVHSLPVSVASSSAGAHTLVVVASDGTNTTTKEIVFNVLTGDTVQPYVPLPNATQVGKPVQFSVRIQPAEKQVSNASFVVERDGVALDPIALNRSGDVFSGRFVPTEPGAYKVSVVVNYADGTSEPAKQVGSFAVAAAPGTGGATGVPVAFVSLLVLAAVTIALAAGGAFWRWKK